MLWGSFGLEEGLASEAWAKVLGSVEASSLLCEGSSKPEIRCSFVVESLWLDWWGCKLGGVEQGMEVWGLSLIWEDLLWVVFRFFLGVSVDFSLSFWLSSLGPFFIDDLEIYQHRNGTLTPSLIFLQLISIRVCCIVITDYSLIEQTKNLHLIQMKSSY